MALYNTYQIRDFAEAWHQCLKNELSVKCNASGNIYLSNYTWSKMLCVGKQHEVGLFNLI